MKVSFKSYRKQIVSAVEAAEDRGLQTAGMMAESQAKTNLRDNESIDTGLLRNSITWAFGGEKPAISSYKADKGNKTGSYSETAPSAKEGKAVYIGTNVEYAPFVEFGTVRSGAKPYLQPAASKVASDFEQILQRELAKISD